MKASDTYPPLEVIGLEEAVGGLRIWLSVIGPKLETETKIR